LACRIASGLSRLTPKATIEAQRTRTNLGKVLIFKFL
jgi:hypothetical protein